MEKGMTGAERFLTEHRTEFLPVIDDKELFDILESDISETIPQERVEHALEEVETKMLVFNKDPDHADKDALRVFLTAAEPLAQINVAALIEKFRNDRRVKGIGLLTDNLAGKQFTRSLTDFEQLRTSGQTPVIYDALRSAQDEPFDVAIVPVDPKNSPNSIPLFNAKEALGVRKIYFFSTGWVGVGASGVFSPEQQQQMEEIDGIFVNDELAGKIIQHQLPSFPKERIFITGTPIADALDISNAEQYIQTGRAKLGLEDDEIAVLVCGHISPPPGKNEEGTHPQISELTFELTMKALIEAARQAPSKKFVTVVRPHPRDPNKDKLMAIANQNLPENLRVVFGTNDKVSMQEAAYGTDATASIVGTDNFLAPMRGRRGIFLAYEDPGMGGELLTNLYGKENVDVIGTGEGITIARTPEEFRQTVLTLERAGLPHTQTDGEGTSIDRITNIVLSGSTQTAPDSR